MVVSDDERTPINRENHDLDDKTMFNNMDKTTVCFFGFISTILGIVSISLLCTALTPNSIYYNDLGSYAILHKGDEVRYTVLHNGTIDCIFISKYQNKAILIGYRTYNLFPDIRWDRKAYRFTYSNNYLVVGRNPYINIKNNDCCNDITVQCD